MYMYVYGRPSQTRTKDHQWHAEEAIRKHLVREGFLREHFPANSTAETVDQIWGPVYKEMVKADANLPNEHRRHKKISKSQLSILTVPL
jgi:hypothetical protein